MRTCLSFLSLSLAISLVFARTIAGAAPSSRPAEVLKAASVQQSEYFLEIGSAPVTLRLSLSIVPKSAGAAVKALFPSTVDVTKVPAAPAEYDAVSLNLELKTGDGETVSLARKVLEIARGSGDTGVQIIKTSLDHGELVVVCGLRCGGVGERIGVWHISMKNAEDSNLRYAQLITDELTFLDPDWSMSAIRPAAMTDKTVGVQLSRGPAGRWIIELTDLTRQRNEVPAMFVQESDRWSFVLDRYLGGARPRGRAR